MTIATYVDTAPFWDGVRDQRLVLPYCPVSGRFQHPPRPVSLYTGRRELEWREISGTGFIYACSTLRLPGPGLDGRLPLDYAIIELDEGVRIIGRLLGCAPGETRIGARVRLTWDRLDGERKYPAFESSSGGVSQSGSIATDRRSG